LLTVEELGFMNMAEFKVVKEMKKLCTAFYTAFKVIAHSMHPK